MKSFIKTFLSIGLSLAMLLTGVNIAFASNKSINQEANYKTDLFAENYSETAIIHGTKYKFEYSYVEGNRVIHVKDVDKLKVDTMVYNEAEATLYWNEVPFAWIETVELQPSVSTLADDAWTFRGQSSHRITFAEGASVAAIAVAIAAVLPSIGLGALGVIGAMGFGALGAIAGTATGGTITTALYTMPLPNGKTQERFVWSFTASTGDYYGPFTYYHTSDYYY